MVNEAVMCHAENVVRCPRDADVGAIFGLGFPPFRGGPLRYVDEVGAEEIVRRLRNLEQQLGSRFAPAPSLVAMASAGRTFHAGDANHAAATGIGA
jgi:3-hydroxyacyl-CoA dehydrogenase/enoyl-CoA hydratase/3-hydroxybutyryl-CoA epimerase